MIDEFLKAKEFLSNIRNTKNQKIDQICISYHPKKEVTFICNWQEKGNFKITKRNRFIDKNGKSLNFTEVLKKIEYLNKNLLDTICYFNFNDENSDRFIQGPVNEEDLKNSFCFSNTNRGLLHTFYPKSEYGQILFCNSYHESLKSNSIILKEEKCFFYDTTQYFFKVDHFDKKFVHIFQKTSKNGPFLYRDRFELNRHFSD